MPRPRTAPDNLVSTNLRIREDLLERIDKEAEDRDLGRAKLVNLLIERGLDALRPPLAPRLTQPTTIVPGPPTGPGRGGTGKVRPRLRDLGADFARTGPMPAMTGPSGPVRQAAAMPPEEKVTFDPPAEPEPTHEPEHLATVIAERQEELHALIPSEGAADVCAWCQDEEGASQHAVHAGLASIGFNLVEAERIIDEALDADVSIEAVLQLIASMTKPPPAKATKKAPAKKAAKASKKTSPKKAPAKRAKPKS